MKWKFYLAVWRWLLSKLIKQGNQYKMRPFYRELLAAHVKEFTEDSESALIGFVSRSFEESNYKCWNCRGNIENSNLRYFEDGVLRNLCLDCYRKNCVPRRLVFSRRETKNC